MSNKMNMIVSDGISEPKGLSRTLSSVARSYAQDLTTPIIASKFTDVKIGPDVFSINVDRPKVIKEVLNLIKADCLRFDKRLWELELSEAKKAGPSSLRPSTKWWDSINAFFEDANLNVDSESLAHAHEAIWRRIGPTMNSGFFKPLAEVRLPLSHFSGMPHLTRTERVHQQILKDAQRILECCKAGEDFSYYYSVLGHRGQSKGTFELPKQRVIWQYPKASVLVGLSWLQVVQPQLAMLDEFVGWNHWSRIDVVVRSMLNQASANHSNVVSMDFSQFDATVSPALVYPLFEKLGMSRQLIPLLNEFFTSAIALPDGMKAGRSKGVPSGHAWTNFIDCLANLTCIYYIAERTGRKVLSATVLGDDSLVVYDTPINLDEMSEIASELGLVLNASKSIAEDDFCHFLQKVYFRGHPEGGIRSIVRTFNSMATMERWDEEVDPMFHVCRWWSQLDEVRFHPARAKFLSWVIRRDRLELGRMDLHAVDSAFSKYTRLNDDRLWRGESSMVPATYWFRDHLNGGDLP
jgi:hypothetical protein